MPWRPLRLREIEAPTFLRQTANKLQQGCQPYAQAALTPRKIPDTNLCWRLSRPQGHSAAEMVR
jgi:hypothetical protein